MACLAFGFLPDLAWASWIDESRRGGAIRGVGPLNGVGVEIRFTPGPAGSIDPQPLGIATIPWDFGVLDIQHLVVTHCKVFLGTIRVV